jgi:hypothetical protein
MKFLSAAAAERFCEHFRAASGAPGQSGTGLPRRAARAMELQRNFQVRSGKPDPFAANVMHMCEHCGNGASFGGWPGSPRGRIKVLNKGLVHAIIGGKDFDGGPAEFLSAGVVGS